MVLHKVSTVFCDKNNRHQFISIFSQLNRARNHLELLKLNN